jgi:hypothetical protein
LLAAMRAAAAEADAIADCHSETSRLRRIVMVVSAMVRENLSKRDRKKSRNLTRLNHLIV